MLYVNLTRLSGKPLAVNPNWVSAIERDEERGLTKVEIGSGLYYWVTEPMAVVIARCEANANRGSV